MGQGNYYLVRTSAATALVEWLVTDPTGSGDADFLIIGDLKMPMTKKIPLMPSWLDVILI